MSLLKYQNFLVGLGEIVSGDKSIMSCSDDDGVEAISELFHGSNALKLICSNNVIDS